MGSHNRPSVTDILKLTEDAMTYYPQQLPVLLAGYSIDQKTGNLENDASFSDVLLPPVPPVLKPHNQKAEIGRNVVASDSPPLVPRRSPVIGQPVSTPVLATSRRPALEPRKMIEPQLAGIHLQSKPLLPSSKPLPPASVVSEAMPESLVISRVVLTAPVPQLNSRIILERGHPTTVIDEADSDAETSRASLTERVVQLSRWPIRSPSLNLHLAAISNPQRCTNEYVDGPTLGPIVTSQVEHELTSFRPQEPKVDMDSSIAQYQHSQDKATESAAVQTKLGISPKYESTCNDGIICSKCGQCRCRKCVERRELPRYWISQQECSVKSAIDWCTCMCFARAIFYHCRPSEDADYSDDPCGGCDQPQCCARWTAMGLLSLCLPCLCCYWPMCCLGRACTSCYNSCCQTQGCRCERNLRLGSRGLLAESESSSF